MHYKIEPWAHQKKAIELAAPRDCFAFLFEQGTGKTSTTVNTLRLKYAKAGKVLPTLILCPPIVIQNWKREFLANSEIPAQQIQTLTGSQFERLHGLEHPHRFDWYYNRILITNYESLLMAKFFEKIKAWPPQVVVLDESHYVKNLYSKRTEACLELGQAAQYRYILTGTPILNSPMDIYPQYLFLTKGEAFGPDFKAFRRKYFVDKNHHMPRDKYFPDWQPRMGAMKAINKIIYEYGMRVTKEECLDLPPLVRQTVEVELTDKQRSFYNTMKKEAIAEANGDVAVADMAALKILRLHQIATGYCPMEEGPDTVFDPNPRLKALMELLKTLTPFHKVIVWAAFQQNYEVILDACRKEKIRAVEITGRVSSLVAKNAAEHAFETDPEVRVLVGHPGACGIGVNLVAASYSIWFSHSFSLGHDQQAEARNYRGGSERHEKVTRIDIIARDTIDELILQALADKQDVTKVVLNHMKGKK